MGLGKQDTLRGIMSVSGIRHFEGKDYHAIIDIQDKPSSKMFRKLETPNHKFFSNHSKEFEKLYSKYRNQELLVKKAPERLKNLLEEMEGKIDSDAADETLLNSLNILSEDVDQNEADSDTAIEI